MSAVPTAAGSLGHISRRARARCRPRPVRCEATRSCGSGWVRCWCPSWCSWCAGVAHEVNNPLMAIAAHAENRLADPAFEGEQRSEMTQILRQARRATKLLRGLLRFVHATDRDVTNVNLNDVVRGALDLVSYRFGVDEITVGGQLDV